LIWAKAEGCGVWDEAGREYIDLTGGFGVAALGHRNPHVLEAIASAPVVHALGDLAEAEVTQRFRKTLPWPAKLGVTGEDAVVAHVLHDAGGGEIRPGIELRQ